MATFEMSGEPKPVVPAELTMTHQLIVKNHGTQLDRYAELRAEKERIESELEAIESNLVSAFTDLNVEKIKTGFGSYTITKRNTKVFNDPEVVRLEEELAAAKEEATKANRYVTQVGKSTIRFTPSF